MKTLGSHTRSRATLGNKNYCGFSLS